MSWAEVKKTIDNISALLNSYLEQTKQTYYIFEPCTFTVPYSCNARIIAVGQGGTAYKLQTGSSSYTYYGAGGGGGTAVGIVKLKKNDVLSCGVYSNASCTPQDNSWKILAKSGRSGTQTAGGVGGSGEVTGISDTKYQIFSGGSGGISGGGGDNDLALGGLGDTNNNGGGASFFGGQGGAGFAGGAGLYGGGDGGNGVLVGGKGGSTNVTIYGNFRSIGGNGGNISSNTNAKAGNGGYGVLVGGDGGSNTSGTQDDTAKPGSGGNSQYVGGNGGCAGVSVKKNGGSGIIGGYIGFNNGEKLYRISSNASVIKSNEFDILPPRGAIGSGGTNGVAPGRACIIIQLGETELLTTLEEAGYPLS